MKLYHTSPEEIEDIDENGLFGSSIFFSKKPYYMTQADNPILYELESEDEDYLDVNKLPYLNKDEYEKIKPIIKKIENITGVNEEEALNLLSERTDIGSFFNSLQDYVHFYSEQDKSVDEKKRKESLFSHLSNKDIGELSWLLQKFAGQAAKALGFKGAKLFDEQGTSYLVDMLGRKNELRKSDEIL